MRATPVFILWVVLSGLAQGASRYREHFFVNKAMRWSAAQAYCRQHYHNLSTITDAEENTVLHKAIEKHAASYSWIGLRQDEHTMLITLDLSKGWHWVDGNPSGYRNWGFAEPNSYIEYCTEMRPDGKWNDRWCGTMNTFFCYKWQHKVVLVTERMSWEEALLHCRKEHADLASLLTVDDVALADAMANEAHTPLVWTSLRFLAGEWLWVSESNQANQEFTQGSLPSCPVQNHRCGARRPSDGQWENTDCQERLNFFCYKDKQRMANHDMANIP